MNHGRSHGPIWRRHGRNPAPSQAVARNGRFNDRVSLDPRTGLISPAVGPSGWNVRDDEMPPAIAVRTARSTPRRT